MKLTLLTLLVVVAGIGCGPDPTPTQTVCPDPDPGTPTYEGFGKPFMEKYCLHCHLSTLKRSQRHGAPAFHDYDSLIGVLRNPNHIDEQAGSGPAATNEIMPPDRCPSVPGGPLDVDCMQPTIEERAELSLWLACEVKRPHDF